MYEKRFLHRISGPNTGQEWSKEGHRNFPLLPRGVPHTALIALANEAYEMAVADNMTLPLPEQTGREKYLDQMPVANNGYRIVQEDPV